MRIRSRRVPRKYWVNASWSVIHHYEDGSLETVYPRNRNFAAVEVHRYTTEDPKSKAHSVVFKNGELYYRRYWNMQYGHWGKSIRAKRERKKS